MSLLSASDLRTDTRAGALAAQVLASQPHAHELLAGARSQVPPEQLTSQPLLRDVDPELVQRLAHRAVVRRLPRHAVVLEQGSRESGLFILLRGQAQLVRHNQRGRSLVLDQLRPGNYFGELSAIDDQPQSASVRCTAPCEVLVISRGDFLEALQESPTLLDTLLKSMVQRVRRKNRRITLLALNDVRGCVVQQLLDLAEDQDGTPVVRGRVSRQAVADMIGASRAMVSRVMMALSRSGDIETLPDGSTAVHCQADDAPRRVRRQGANGPNKPA